MVNRRDRGQWASRCASGIVTLIVLFCLSSFAAPAQSQDTAGQDEALALIEEGRDLMKARDQAGAADKFMAAIGLTAKSGDPVLAMVPYAAFAENYMTFDNQPKAVEYADFVLNELADERYRAELPVLRALMVKGVVLWLQDKNQEAEVLLNEMATYLGAHPSELHNRFMRGLIVLARIKLDVGDPSALLFAEGIRIMWQPDGESTEEDFAVLLYNELLARRFARGEMSAQEAITGGRSVVLRALSLKSLDIDTVAAIQQQYAGLLIDERQLEESRYWAERVEALYDAEGVYGFTYLLNGETLMFLDHFAGQGESALSRGERLRDIALGAVPPQTELGAVFERNLGLLLQAYGEESTAQERFRNAYKIIREVRRVYDENVTIYRDLIDIDDPGMALFPLAPEFGARIAPPPYRPNGSGVLRMYLSGNYLSLGEAMAGEATAPLELLNVALFHAVGGNYGAMVDTLRKGRAAARTTLGSNVPPNSPWFDLIELVGTVWGTAHTLHSAESVISRLDARADRLSPEARSVYLAFKGFKHLQADEVDGMVQTVTTWLEEVDWSAEPSIWELFAATVVLEVAYRALPIGGSAALYDKVRAQVDAFSELTLASDYVELIRYAKGVEETASVEGVLRLAAVTKRLQASAPKPVSFRASSRITYAEALITRQEYEAAIQEYSAAVSEYRQDPYHREDVLAYLISRQALISFWMDDAANHRLFARQAYELLIATDNSLPSLRADPIEAYALTFWYRNETDQAIDMLEAHLADPGFVEGMEGSFAHMRLVTLLAQLNESMGNHERALEIYRSIDEETATLGEVNPLMRSSYLENRALTERNLGNLGAAFEQINRANTIFFGLLRQREAGSVTGTVASVNNSWRIGTEASIGWDYAQTLPE